MDKAQTSRFLVYRASAGSGKTHTLALRYVALLLRHPGGEAFRHILTVTFTNLATAEMKQRILEFLYRLSRHIDHEAELASQVGSVLAERGISLEAEEMSRRAADSLSAILHDYSYFRVETIDSFLQSVLRNMARELGLNARLRVELNDQEMVSAAVDRLIDGLSEDEAESDARRWIGELLREELDAGRVWNVAEVVKNFAGCIFDETFLSRSDDERRALRSPETIGRFIGQMKRIETECEQQAEALGRQTITDIEALPLNFDRIKNAPYYRKMLERMLAMETPKLSDTVNRALYEDSSLLLKKTDQSLTAEAEDAARLLRQAHEQYLGLYSDHLTARLALRDIHKLRLLGLIEDLADDIADENNRFALSRTPTLLSEMVGDDDAPFIFEKAGTTFHNVMIDEFQDTSLMQWRNFRVLLVDNQASAGEDLLVGDVKQSIYRWRNGDWRILQEIDQEKALPVKPHVEPLKENFRSDLRIVTFNNNFFAEAARRLDAIAAHQPTIAELYHDVEQQPHRTLPSGHIAISLYQSKKKNDEEYWQQMVSEMVQSIEQLQQTGLSLNQMAILVREKNDGAELIRRFAQAAPHLRLVSDEAYLLCSGRSVEIIIAMLRSLTSEADPVSQAFLVDQGIEPFTADERQRLLAMPFHLMCEELARLALPHCPPGQEAYLHSLFDALQNFQQGGSGDAVSFLRAWDESLWQSPVTGGDIDGLRVLTIHKSKGLQFHTVLLPATHWKIFKHRPDERMWMKADDQRFNTLGPLPVSPSQDLAFSHYASEYEEEMFQRRVDAINTLYVAFTRAERNLLVWGQTKAESSTKFTLTDDASAGDIICATLGAKLEPTDTGFSFSEGEIVGPDAAREDTSRTNPLNLEGGEPLTLPFVSLEPRLVFRQSNESRRFVSDCNADAPQPLSFTDIGKVMHYVLSLIRTESDIPNVIRQCREQGLLPDEKTQNHVLERLKQGFRDELVRSWFSDDCEVINETNIIGKTSLRPDQTVHRPDRVVIRQDTLSVIDYKFARPDSEHQTQILAYADLLGRLRPDLTIRAYLWYVYQGEVVEVTPSRPPRGEEVILNI